MRPLRLTLALLVAGPAAALPLACGDDDVPSPSRAQDDAGPGRRSEDAATDPSDAATPRATLRIAHAAPELGPIDFCYREPGNTAFEGPFLSGAPRTDRGDASADADADASVVVDADADAGPSIDYRTVTAYADVEVAGTIEIAIVPAGASCAEALVTRSVTLDPGKRSTVIVLGRAAVDGGAASLGLVGLVDDLAPADAGARVRVVHAALRAKLVPSPLLVRVVSEPPRILAERVEPRRASSPSGFVDSLGYATVLPLAENASIAVSDLSDAGAGTWESAAAPLGLENGAVVTTFLLPDLEDDTRYEALVCRDDADAADVTACALVR